MINKTFRKRLAVLSVGLYFAVAAFLVASEPKVKFLHFDEELAKVDSDTALVFPSEAIDEYPLWSPDGRYLAFNVEDEWKKLDLSKIKLSPANWRGGQSLGVLADRAAVSTASKTEISAWRKRNVLNPRKAIVGSSVVELRSAELSTELVVTSPGRKEQVRWSSSEENCHSLVVAPDQQHVAFICEMNGVIVLRAVH